MSLKTQAKVLRALDEQRFYPVGATPPVHVDARVIAATNKDLEEEIARGNFREDLFYRLNVIPFFVPPLRDRKEDIPLLARSSSQEFGQQYGRPHVEITPPPSTRCSAVPLARQRPRAAQRHRARPHPQPQSPAHRAKHIPPLVSPEATRHIQSAPAWRVLHTAEAREAYERDYILKELDGAAATSPAPPKPSA